MLLLLLFTLGCWILMLRAQHFYDSLYLTSHLIRSFQSQEKYLQPGYAGPIRTDWPLGLAGRCEVSWQFPREAQPALERECSVVVATCLMVITDTSLPPPALHTSVLTSWEHIMSLQRLHPIPRSPPVRKQLFFISRCWGLLLIWSQTYDKTTGGGQQSKSDQTKLFVLFVSICMVLKVTEELQ